MSNRRTELTHAVESKLVGACLIFLSVTQIAVSAESFRVMSYGAWWAGVLVLVTGMTAVFSQNRSSVSFGLISSILSIVFCFIGITWDSTGFLLSDLQACAQIRESNITSTSDMSFINYGDQDDVIVGSAEGCAEHFPHRDCACVRDDVEFCFTFNMNVDSCEPLMTTMPPLLMTSFAFLIAMLALSIVFSCLTCCTLCRHHSVVVHPVNFRLDSIPAVATYTVIQHPQPSTGVQTELPMLNQVGGLDMGAVAGGTVTAASSADKPPPTYALQPVALAYAV